MHTRSLTVKHTPQTEQLAEFRQHIVAWQDALAAAQFALQFETHIPNSDEDKRLARLLSFYAVVAYARPFGKNNGLSKLGEKGDGTLMELRNQIGAHTDADRHTYLTDVEITLGKVTRTAVPATRLIPYMPKVVEASSKEIEKISMQIIALEDKIDQLGLADGKYGQV
jgi:hypothetical protein